MNLVVGSTGLLGGEICRRLRAAKLPVKGLIRPTSQAESIARLESLGVELVEGDLRDRRSLDKACTDVTAVFSTATAIFASQPGDSIETVDLWGQINLVEAACAAAVLKFIYISYSGEIGVNDPLTVAKRMVEKRLRESGMAYTILRPSYFMEVWFSPEFGFDFLNANAIIYGSGDPKISWISMRDVAEFAVQSLENPRATDATIELGGPEALSPLEVIQIFTQLGGKIFNVEALSLEDLEAEQASASDTLAKVFAALKLAYAKGNRIGMEEILKTFPLKLTSVKEYAGQAFSG